MPIPKPPQRPTEDSDRRIQRFLERAASIVFEGPELTAERWQQLSSIATEYELTSEQFRTTLEDLVARGVLHRVDATLPKPPPLPKVRANDELRPAIPPRQPDAVVPPTRSKVTPPQRPPLVLSATIDDEGDAEIGRSQVPAAESTPMSLPPSNESAATNSTSNKPDPVEGSNGGAEKVDGRWRVEGAPAPEPVRPTKKTREIYNEFVRQSLSYVERNEISPAIEQRLLYHGTRVLSLSTVYARHLLEQIAADLGFHFALPEQSASSSDSSKDLAEGVLWEGSDASASSGQTTRPAEVFAEPSAASSVKMAERKVPFASPDVPQNRATAKSDYIQLERVVPLREYLHASLDRIPRGLLPLPVLDKLMNAGDDLFGVNSDLVLETIRHVAGELKIAVVTRQQAEEYVSEFVESLLDNDVVLSINQFDQVRQTGGQWGLNSAQTDAIVDQICSARLAARRREEFTVRLALGAAGIAVLLVVSFIGYAFLSAQSNRSNSPSSQPSAVQQ